MGADRATTALIRYAPIPPAVQLMIIDVFPDIAASLVHNRHLTVPATESLLRMRLTVEEATELVSNFHSPEQVQQLLAAGERRHGPIGALLGQWDLDEDQQMAVANGRIQARTAAALMGCSSPHPAACSVAASRADMDTRARWLAGAAADVSAPDALAHIEALSESGQFRVEIAQALHAQPSLLRWAAGQDSTVVQSAASALETPPDVRGLLLERVLTGEVRSHTRSYLLADLLDSPALDPVLRARAWASLSTSERASLALRGVPKPGSAHDIGIPLDVVDEPRILDLLVSRDAGGQAPSARAWQLFELSSNPNLDAYQKLQLAAKLGECSYQLGERRATDAAVSLADAATELGCAELDYLRRRWDQYQADIVAPPAAGRGARPRFSRSARRAPGRMMKDGLDTPIREEGSAWGGAPEHAGTLLLDLLGDEPHVWRALLALLPDFGGTVADLAQVARNITA